MEDLGPSAAALENAGLPPAEQPPPLLKRRLLDVAGYIAARGYGEEAWRICYICRLGS
jgi:hypothetical protein